MSFIDQDDILQINEQLLRTIWQQFRGVDPGTLPRLTFEEAMNRFGSDKPDLRIPWELKDLAAVAGGSGFKVFDDVLARGGAIKGLAIPGQAAMARAQIDKLTEFVKQYGAKGLVWIKDDGREVGASVKKFFDDDRLRSIMRAAGGQTGDIVFVIADERQVACAALGALRSKLAVDFGAVDLSRDRCCWVVDFPLFEYDPSSQRWSAAHHPFTAPQDQHLEILLNRDESRFSEIKAKAYDLVCNGYELGGGSIRIHRSEIQQSMFNALGLTEEEIRVKFGFFVEALSFGTPPHGGIAWGLDRLTMVLCNTDAIREVIAFPKTAKAQDLMAEAPSPVGSAQLLELGLKISRTD
jgi:aspartyl-tRNA synthetase